MSLRTSGDLVGAALMSQAALSATAVYLMCNLWLYDSVFFVTG